VATTVTRSRKSSAIQRAATSNGVKSEVLEVPHGKDVDAQMIVDLRRMLRQAGFAPDDGAPTPDKRRRDHGDGQWGEPT
jgi:hypothetical protein